MIDPVPQPTDPVTPPVQEQENWKSFIIELVKVAAIAAVTIFLVRYFLFKPFYVKGESMEPNFYNHEYLIIDELSYRLRAPERGEVVVLRDPYDTTEYFIKRIVALPGERIKISDGKITIYNQTHPEGIVLDESYLPKDLLTSGEKTTELGPDQYFVLGDNRGNSLDSRRFGPIDKNLIVGRVWVRGWPLNRIQIFEAPVFSNM